MCKNINNKRFILGLLVSAVLFAGLFSSCIISDDGVEVEIKNETDSTIQFIEFSYPINKSLPLELISGESKKINYDRCLEDLEFTVKINDVLYYGTTNYVQDSARYKLKVFKEGESYKSRVSGNEVVILTKTNN